MDKKYSNYNLEDFLLDEEFFGFCKSVYRTGDLQSLDSLLSRYPGKKEMMKTAYLMINGIRLKEADVSNDKIKKSFSRLENTRKIRRSRRIIYGVSSVAACFLLAVLSFYYVNLFSVSDSDKVALLNELSNVKDDSGDIQIIMGDNKKTVSDKSATIREKEDGTFVVNDRAIQPAKKEIEYIQIVVPRGKRSYIELKDGTNIWVNSGSKLLYPSQFDEKERKIYVEGEIYLEVEKDKSLPFIVHTDKLDVRVLGTSFNVSAYPDDLFTDVVLVEGSVEITTNEKEKTALSPNFRYRLENNESRVQPVEVDNYICWKDGFMKVEGEELHDIFKRLSRYYNITISTSPDVEKVRYFGKLGLVDSIEEVLHNISLVEPIDFKNNTDSLYIWKKQ